MFLILAAALSVIAACSAGRETPAAERAPQIHVQPGPSRGILQPAAVRLVDSSDVGAPGEIATPLFRVQVTARRGIDTIPGVWTRDLPAVGADRNVYGFSQERSSGWIEKAYRYDPETRQLSDLELPPDVEMVVTQLAVSPDARNIAYVSIDSVTSYYYGVVRSWPDDKLVAQTPAVRGGGSEVDLNEARWTDANHAEFIYQTTPEIDPVTKKPLERWIHALVTVDARTMKVDTLDAKPDWRH